jgi:hypothetical protein
LLWISETRAEIECIGGQIIVSPVQNIAAGLQRLRKADRRGNGAAVGFVAHHKLTQNVGRSVGVKK